MSDGSGLCVRVKCWVWCGLCVCYVLWISLCFFVRVLCYVLCEDIGLGVRVMCSVMCGCGGSSVRVMT